MRSSKTYWRAIRRYFLLFTAIALLPLALVYLVTNDQIYKIKGFEFINDTKIPIIPDESIQTLSQSDMLMVEQRMDKRRKHLAEKCSEHGLDSAGNDSWHKPNPWEFLVNQKYHIIWCNVFKAASSSWMYNFNILAGYTPEFLRKTNEVPLVLARKRYPRVSLEELQEAQNDSITFIIARHPFERLLSAYRDKFMYAVPHSFHDKLGSKIVRTYRKKHKPDRHTPRYPTFAEFVTWLLDEIHRNNFIDMHLVPASKFCTPCLINFDIIIKFETLEHDQVYLIDKAHLKHIIAPEWRNSGKGKNTLDLLQAFYSQLTRKQLDGLYEYYKYDFEVFNYNAAPYFSIAKKNEEETTNNAS